MDEPTGFDKNRGAIFGRRGLAAAVIVSETSITQVFPYCQIRGISGMNHDLCDAI
jgi:hypothetical protein